MFCLAFCFFRIFRSNLVGFFPRKPQVPHYRYDLEYQGSPFPPFLSLPPSPYFPLPSLLLLISFSLPSPLSLPLPSSLFLPLPFPSIPFPSPAFPSLVSYSSYVSG